jgi:transcriptional regulator with XRE-family HTH domain
MGQEQMKKQVLEELNLGGKIKELRKQKGMTLKDLAERTGFSPALLSQVENNIVSPSISTLWNFAKALGVKIGFFFEQEAAEAVSYALTRSGQGPRIRRAELPQVLDTADLAHGLEDRNMSPLFLECQGPCEFSIRGTSYGGEELLYIVDGGVVVWYGDERFELGVGDSMYYKAQVPHKIEALEGARFVAVLYEAHRQ